MKKFRITGVAAREILDCRWNPTVQVDVWVNNEILGRADVPSGRSTGANEAKELRDGEERYDGMGVRRAVRNVNEILGPEVVDMDVTDQRKIDEKLRHLVDVYSNMKPKQAAEVLATLDERIAVKILAGMRGKQAGEVLSYMQAAPAAKLSELLSRTQIAP